MTLVVLWGTSGHIMCAADTRLTSESRETITEHGGKLVVVPIRWSVTGEVREENRSSFYSLGFAFCGSTLIASNTHAIATTCAQILHTEKAEVVPSSDLIAQIYSRVGEHVTKDVNGRLPGKNIVFQGFLFGYCPIKKTFRNHIINPVIENGFFSMKVESSDVRDGDVFAIGSGCSEFLRLSEERNAAGNRRPILDILQQIMKSGTVRDVGGYPQVAIADTNGVQLRPVLLQNPENPDQSLLTINGFDTSKVTNNEGFSFGLEAFGIGVEAIIGRNALRAKGINPDAGAVPRETQNLASFEAALQYAHLKRTKVSIDDNYTVSPQMPNQGTWCFVAPCRCGRKVPYLLDPSEGSMGKPFIGNGRIETICTGCGQAISAGADQLTSTRWTG